MGNNHSCLQSGGFFLVTLQILRVVRPGIEVRVLCNTKDNVLIMIGNTLYSGGLSYSRIVKNRGHQLQSHSAVTRTWDPVLPAPAEPAALSVSSQVQKDSLLLRHDYPMSSELGHLLRPTT